MRKAMSTELAFPFFNARIGRPRQGQLERASLRPFHQLVLQRIGFIGQLNPTHETPAVVQNKICIVEAGNAALHGNIDSRIVRTTGW